MPEALTTEALCCYRELLVEYLEMTVNSNNHRTRLCEASCRS
jgi:hypothetical protein